MRPAEPWSSDLSSGQSSNFDPVHSVLEHVAGLGAGRFVVGHRVQLINTNNAADIQGMF